MSAEAENTKSFEKTLEDGFQQLHSRKWVKTLRSFVCKLHVPFQCNQKTFWVHRGVQPFLHPDGFSKP
ncbi:MAG: hypothetical protein ACPHRG_08320, partial [Parvibaculales bacterium]